MKDKRGFSIAETVIAMAVIVIISVSILSIVSYSKVKSEKNLELTSSIVIMENALEIFKASSSEDSFSNWIKDSYNFDKVEGQYKCTLSYYDIYITITGDNNNNFNSVCKDKNGEIIVEVGYAKA